MILVVSEHEKLEWSPIIGSVGFEFSDYYKPNRWLTIDADVAFARARFRDPNPAGNRIPGAVDGVASLALAVDKPGAMVWCVATALLWATPAD